MNDKIELCELANRALNDIAAYIEAFDSDTDLKNLTQEQIASAGVLLLRKLMSSPLTLMNPLILMEIKNAFFQAEVGTLDELIRRSESELREKGFPEVLIKAVIQQMLKGNNAP